MAGRRRSLQQRVGAVAVLVVAAACGGANQADVATGTSSSSTAGPTSTLVAVTTSTTEATKPVVVATAPSPSVGGPTTSRPPRAPSVGTMVGGVDGQGGLRQRDVPPQGVAALAGFALGATDGCFPPSPPPPSPRITRSSGEVIGPSNASIEVGTRPGGFTLLCAEGFGPQPVRFEVRLPDGRVRRPPSTDASLSLVLSVLDPLGTYAITATQGGRQATARLTATLPAAPAVETLSPGTGPPGTTFAFGVASSRPNQAVNLDVYAYAPGHQQGTYLTSLVAARTDGSGRVVYRLPTRPDDPRGSYSVNVRGDGGVGARFTVG